MWTVRKQNCLAQSLLTIGVVSCVSLVYLYFFHAKKDIEIENEPLKSEKLSEECIPVCDTSECIIQANMLLRNMKTKADPCDNFRTFLCGDFEEKIGPDEKGNVLSEVNNRMMKKLEEIIENIEAEPGSASAKLKILYDSCIDYGHELHALTTAKKFLDDLGILNWPYLQRNFKFSTHSLSAVIGKLKLYGVFDFLIFQVRQNSTELVVDKKVVSILFSQFFAKYSKFPNEKGFEILKYFDLELEEMNEIVEDHETVENSIFKLQDNKTGEGNRTDSFHVCSGNTDLEIQYLCDAVKSFLYYSELNDTISDDVIGIGRYDDIARQVIPLLESFSDRSVANFLALKFFWRHLGELNLYFRRLKKDYVDQENVKEPFYIDTPKYCINCVSKFMVFALAHEFFQHYLTRPALEQVFHVYDEYITNVGDIISRQSWISPILRSTLEEEIRNITNNILYFKEILPNETFVNEYYSVFNPIRGNFFHNVLELRRSIYISHYREIQTFHEYGIRERALQGTRFAVQASTAGDSINFHFGIFFVPFYLYGLERQFNFASLGLVISHELGHILQFSLQEKTEEEEYNKTIQSFLERKQCIEDQFSKFKFRISKEKLNGTQYFIENLSDSLSTSLFDRMIGSYDSSWEEIFLPGVPYSGKELLFISANQFWCSKSDLKLENHYKTKDSHAPLEFRILGSMQNSRRFSEVFHCPSGSFMNPDIKCSLLDEI